MKVFTREGEKREGGSEGGRERMKDGERVRGRKREGWNEKAREKE